MERVFLRRIKSAAFTALFCFLLSFASASGETVSFSWDKTPDSDIAGYRLYFGTTSGVYSQYIEVDAQTTTASLDLFVGAEYHFVVTALNTGGGESPPSNEVTYIITASGSDKVLVNVSTRGVVENGDGVMIGGFIVTGTKPKQVLMRAIGPSLTAAGVSGALSDPEMELYDAAGTLIKQNDNATSALPAVAAAGLVPQNSSESLITARLSPGAYTCVIRGMNGATGVALCEVYDLTPNASRVGNISTRGHVGSADSVLIGGFILGGQAPTQVIVRAIGPSLSAYGVTGVLQNPVLAVYDSNGFLLFSNDSWRATQKQQIIDTGLPPSNDREAAIVATLAPGAYTAVVRSSNGKTGVALVEVYNLDN